MSFLLFSISSEGHDLVASPLTPPTLLVAVNTGTYAHIHTHSKKNVFMELFHTISLVLPIATAIFKELIFTFLACHEKYIEK